MAMIKNKHITFSLIFVCLIVVSPVAKAQLGLGGLGGGLGGLGGLIGGLVNGLFSVVNITGVLFCSPNGALNGTSTPAFASKLSILLLCTFNLIDHAKPAQQNLHWFCNPSRVCCRLIM